MFWVYVKQTVDSIGVWKRTEHWAGNIVLIPAHRCIACGWCTTQNETNRERESEGERVHRESNVMLCSLFSCARYTKKFLFFFICSSPFPFPFDCSFTFSCASAFAAVVVIIIIVVNNDDNVVIIVMPRNITLRSSQIFTFFFKKELRSALLCYVEYVICFSLVEYVIWKRKRWNKIVVPQPLKATQQKWNKQKPLQSKWTENEM